MVELKTGAQVLRPNHRDNIASFIANWKSYTQSPDPNQVMLVTNLDFNKGQCIITLISPILLITRITQITLINLPTPLTAKFTYKPFLLNNSAYSANSAILTEPKPTNPTNLARIGERVSRGDYRL